MIFYKKNIKILKLDKIFIRNIFKIIFFNKKIINKDRTILENKNISINKLLKLDNIGFY